MLKARFTVARVCCLDARKHARIRECSRHLRPDWFPPPCASSAGRCSRDRVANDSSGRRDCPLHVHGQNEGWTSRSARSGSPHRRISSSPALPCPPRHRVFHVQYRALRQPVRDPGCISHRDRECGLACSGSSSQWGIEIKQSNGSAAPRNDFQRRCRSDRNFSARCQDHARWRSRRRAARHRRRREDPCALHQGGLVKVGLLNASGSSSRLAATGPVSVAVKIDSNPGGGHYPERQQKPSAEASPRPLPCRPMSPYQL